MEEFLFTVGSFVVFGLLTLLAGAESEALIKVRARRPTLLSWHPAPPVEPSNNRQG